MSKSEIIIRNLSVEIHQRREQQKEGQPCSRSRKLI